MDDATLIEELELSVRSGNVLKNASLKTVGQLRRVTDRALLREPNFGRISLNEVRALVPFHIEPGETEIDQLPISPASNPPPDADWLADMQPATVALKNALASTFGRGYSIGFAAGQSSVPHVDKDAVYVAGVRAGWHKAIDEMRSMQGGYLAVYDEAYSAFVERTKDDGQTH